MRLLAPKLRAASSSSFYSQREPRQENPCPLLDRTLSGGLPAASTTEVGGSASGKISVWGASSMPPPAAPCLPSVQARRGAMSPVCTSRIVSTSPVCVARV
ncbi:hypothetical protein GQ55_5G333800 [Panicum hallii var. hallii]|uniref:Uncharacterized protein n=1 Tax=Panicum hallii var. hallii TaxID=1504633 RepID=A0A2T7DLY2_9POAL|nr:hypothetical protein GQ55_5G333800 [Panicum hallii var. hallii]